MFFFNKKTISSSGLFNGMTDNHSHILPSVDDGVQSMEQSLRILSEYERLGVSKVWLTPHIMEDIPNTTEDLRKRYEELKAAYNGPVTLMLAAEYMLDNNFEERLSAGDLLLHSMPNEPMKKILVETSYYNPPIGLYDIFERIKSAGYYPILAHPERYNYMTDKDYEKIRSMNIIFQLNIFSLTSQYGPHIQQKAEKLLKGGYYSMLGSDIHRYQALMRQINVKLPKSIIAALEQIR